MSRYENYDIKNNVFGTLSAPISSLTTTIQLGDGQGQRFSVNMLATLENIENGKVMKREIVLITAINGDVLTVTRKVAPCPSSDDANTQGQVSYAFSADDTISAYIDKEHFDNIKNSIDDLYNNGNDRLYVKGTGGLNAIVTAGNVRVGNTDFQFAGGNIILQDNSTNYVMLSDAGSLNISIIGREDTQVKIATVTTSGGEITNINMRKTDTVGGKIESGGGTTEAYIAGENLSKGDIVCVKDYDGKGNPQTSLPLGNGVNSKLALQVYGSGATYDTIYAYLGIVGSGQDISVRVETDDNGSPSGTLVSANATATILASSLTTTLTKIKITLDGLISLALPDKYRVVLSCSGSDSSNYVIVGAEGYNFTPSKKYSGTSWSQLISEDVTITSTSSGYGSVSGSSSANTIWTITRDTRVYIETISFSDVSAVVIYDTTTSTQIYSGAATGINTRCEIGHTYEFRLTCSGVGIQYRGGYSLQYASYINNDESWGLKSMISFTIKTENYISLSSSLFKKGIVKVNTKNRDRITDNIGIIGGDVQAGNLALITTQGGVANIDTYSLYQGEIYYQGTQIVDDITRDETYIILGEALSDKSIKLDVKIALWHKAQSLQVCPISGVVGPLQDGWNGNYYATNMQVTINGSERHGNCPMKRGRKFCPSGYTYRAVVWKRF